MADNFNLVDNMLDEINQNNPDHVLSYNPGMQQNGAMMGGPQHQPQYAHSPVQPQRQVRMGEVQYIPPDQQQAPTMQNGMAYNMANEHMVDEDGAMEAPDLSSYGMEEDGGMMNNVFNEAKAPLIVVVLAFLMSLPQVSGMVRNLVARFTTNPLYVNVLLAALMGVAFYVVMKVTA